jgi:TolB protein
MRFLTIATLAIAATLGAYAPSHAQERVRVTVEGENFIPLRIAIPDFDATGPGATETAKQIADVVRADLQGSAVFELIDKNAFIERDTDIGLTPRFPDWTTIDAKALIVGNVVVDAANTLNVQFRLWNVYGNEQQFSTQYKVPTPLNWRRLAHKIADDIYQQLTGDPGYFDTRVVFVAESGPPLNRKRRLAIMDQDGANAEFLLPGVDLVTTPRFSPTSQTIIYSAYVPDPRNPNATILRTYLYDIQTGRREGLGDATDTTAYAARFSPDGRYVAMTRALNGNSDVYLVELARRTERRLTTASSSELSPSFSPDGKQITFVSDRGRQPQIYIMREDGGTMPCPTGGNDTACRITFGEGQYTTPVWSPRGDWIAFTYQAKGMFHIGVIRPDGTGERMLTSSYSDHSPTWSPNGRVIAFTREAAPGAGPKIWSIDVTGRNLHRMPTPGDASMPAWSPLLK